MLKRWSVMFRFAGAVKRGVIAGVVALGLLTFSSAYAASINVVGATIPLDAIMRPLQPGFEKASGMELKLVDAVFPEILNDLMDEKYDAYVTTSPLEQSFWQLKNEGMVLTEEQKKKIHATEVVRIPLAVFVNKANPLSKISTDQLTAILSGKMENWKQLTGQNLPIRTVMLSGLMTPLSYQLLGGGDFGPKMVFVETLRDMKLEAIATKHVLEILPATAFISELKKVEGPAMVKTALLITKGEPSEKVKKLIEYIRGEGQKNLRMFKAK